MAKAAALPAWQRALILLTGTVVAVVVIACLYWAQTIFMPVALAIFLTFLLSPLVSFAGAAARGEIGRWPLGIEE
jgi:predicted PurR-regulated permease PerM